MVKVVDRASGRPGAWRSSLLLALLGMTWIANACGGRTVWVEDETAGSAGSAGHSDDDDGGFGGVAGYGGAYGGGGDYGGAYGGYGGAYGGYGGDYGGAYGGYGGDYGGTYGGFTGGGTYPTGGSVITGGYGGTYAGSAGVVTGGYGGTYAGSAGVAGKGGCGAVSGSGGSTGSPLLGKACTAFCPKYPYAGCPSDFEGPRDCLAKCQNGFSLGSWCHPALVDFLFCASNYLDPGAMCFVQGGQCFGPGCTVDAVNACAAEYVALLECQDSPRPLPPCPPPPNPPLPPNCGLMGSGTTDYCLREAACPGYRQTTECFAQNDAAASWYCDCFTNGVYQTSVSTSGSTRDVCQSGAALCGYY